MAAESKIFKTADCIDDYSRGTFFDPIFKWTPYYFRGDIGQARDIEVFLKNTGDQIFIGTDPGDPLQCFVHNY